MSDSSALRVLIAPIVCLLALIAAGCGGGGGGGGTDPIATSIEPGSWAGSITSSLAGRGAATLDITDASTGRSIDLLAASARAYKTYVSGTWIADFNGQIYDNGGIATGVFENGLLEGTLESSFEDGCTSDFSAIVTEGGISGTSLTTDCDVDDSTSFDLSEVSGSIPSIDGSWSGQLSSSSTGTGLLTASIEQTGLNFDGNMSTDFSNFDSSGYFAGRISGNRIFFNYYPDSLSDCPFAGSGTIGSNGVISGSFSAFDCSQNVSGSFSMSID